MGGAQCPCLSAPGVVMATDGGLAGDRRGRALCEEAGDLETSWDPLGGALAPSAAQVPRKVVDTGASVGVLPALPSPLLSRLVLPPQTPQEPGSAGTVPWGGCGWAVSLAVAPALGWETGWLSAAASPPAVPDGRGARLGAPAQPDQAPEGPGPTAPPVHRVLLRLGRGPTLWGEGPSAHPVPPAPATSSARPGWRFLQTASLL